MDGETRDWHDDSSAATHWRALFVAVTPPVVLASLAEGLLVLVGGGTGTAIVDGELLRTGGTPDLVVTLIWAVAWAYGVTAAMLVFRGALVGEPIGGVTALKAALRRGHIVFGVLVVAFVAVVVAVFLAGLTAGFLGPLAFGVLAVALFFPTRIIAAFPVAALDGQGVWGSVGRSQELADGRRWQLFWLCAGIVLLPVPVSWLRDWAASLHLGLWKVALASLVVSLLLAAVVALQGAILARWRFRLDGRVPPGSPARADRWRAAFAVHAVGGLCVIGLAAVNPFGVPELTGASAQSRQPHHAVLDGGATTIAVNHRDDAKPQLVTCRTNRCDTTVASLDRPGFTWDGPMFVVREMPSGGLAVVAAVVQQGDEVGTADVVAWLCPDRTCSTSRRVVLADGIRTERDDFAGMFPVSMGSDLMSPIKFRLETTVVDGRLAVAYNDGRGRAVTVARCADTACSRHEDEHAILDSAGRLAGFGFDARGRLVLVGAEQPVAPAPGLRLRIGRDIQPTFFTIVCRPEGPCDGRTTWGIVTDAGMEAWPVTLPGGRPALIVEERGGARLVICERNCSP